MKISVLIKCSLLGCLMFACEKQNASSPKRIVTDLSNERTVLYWVETPFIFQGLCKEGGPLLSSNCQKDLQFMNYEDFKVDLENSLSKDIDAVKDQIAVIQVNIQATERQLALLQKNLYAHKYEMLLSQEEEAALKDNIALYEGYIGEYQEQIAHFNRFLEENTNKDVLELSEDLANEINRTSNQLNSFYSRLPEVITKINALIERIVTEEAGIIDINSQLNKLELNLNDQMLILTTLEEDFRHYEQTLFNLEDSVGIYRVLDPSNLFSETKEFVRRFAGIFPQAH